VTTPILGQFVICRLGVAMFNPHTKFEVYTITCNEEMKGNAKCKNSRFEPPFGWLRGNAQGSSMDQWKSHFWLPASIAVMTGLTDGKASTRFITLLTYSNERCNYCISTLRVWPPLSKCLTTSYNVQFNFRRRSAKQPQQSTEYIVQRHNTT